MKTVTKEYTVYTYDELSKEAKEKALNKWREGNDYFFLEDCMNERLHELLEENQIQDTNDTSEPGTKPTQVLYSLSCCQGDGAMFEGVYIWNGYTVTIKHSGHYYHSYSKDIDITDEEGNEPETDEPLNAFESIYQNICKELEQYGYNFIEYEDSEENFIECYASELYFLEDGTLFNE